MAVAITEENQCRVIKWTEARASKCFLADTLETSIGDMTHDLQLYIPKPSVPKESKRQRQSNCLHTSDKCDPLGLGLMWDTCFLRLQNRQSGAIIPLTRELLMEALSGLTNSQAVQHDLFQDAAVVCDAPSQNDHNITETDVSDDEQLTIRSIAEEVDIGDDECGTSDEEGSDQDEPQDDEEEEEFEEEEEL